MVDTDLLGMSDDDFLKMNGPPEAPSLEGASATSGEGGNQEEVILPPESGVQGQEAGQAVTDQTGGEAKGADQTGTTGTAVVDGEEPKVVKPSDTPEPVAAKPADGAQGADPATGVKPSEPVAGAEPEEIDYKSSYEQVMAPFKANGKTVQVANAEEAIKLMQMGANYTRKLQELQPAKKLLMMMESNQLDESKLSYLIDLDKKDPEAIKKLIKDSGIDPLELDLNTVSYQPTNRSVSDQELNFSNALDTVQETEEGRQTVNLINTWDAASKEALWDNPQIMVDINAQRATGVYDKISSEIDRRKMLGLISPTTPFLQAYTQVGDQLANSGGFNDLIVKAGGKPAVVPPENRQVIDTSRAAPKPDATNGEQARAAAGVRTTPKPAAVFKNPLAMSDAEFLAQMGHRV